MFKFRMDSPFIQIGTKIANMLILNLYFIVGCLPILTIGASVTALFTVCLDMVQDKEDPKITRTFWKAWVRNLGHGILFTLIFGVVLYAIWMNLQLFNKLPDNPLIFLILGILAILLLFVHMFYAFALDARYDNTLLMMLVNSRKICIRYFMKTLMLAGILAVQIMMFYFTNQFFTTIGLFIAPVLMAYTMSQVLVPILENIEVDRYATDGFSISGV